MSVLRACLQPRVLAPLLVAGLAVVVLAPGLIAAAIPLLIIAACPLSMLLMMRSMAGQAPERAVDPNGGRVTELRRELAHLAERQRRLESQLAARESASDAVSTPPTGSETVREG